MSTPRDTLTIGVTGHRPQRLGRANLAKISTMIAEVLDAVAAAARDVGGDVELRLVTALAEGADSMAADAARARAWTLDCVLPFARDDYATDFKDPGAADAYHARLAAARSVFELPADRAQISDPHAYERAGRVVLAQCDILLAIWDRGPVQGRGGTGQIVAEAVIEDVPVILIDPGGAAPPTLLWDGLEAHDLGQQTVDTVPRSGLDALPRVIRSLLDTADGAANLAMRQFYSDAPLPRWTLALAFPLLLAVMGVRGLKASDARVADVADAEAPILAAAAGIADRADAFVARMRTALAPRFAKADVMATHIGQMFRSGYVINFALAALAVALSLSGLALPPQAKPFLIVLELAAIGTILFLTRTAHRVAWHQRWLDCRHLAERLRCLAISAQLGDLTLRVGADSEPRWVAGAVRATARTLGLPSTRVDEAYLAAVRAALIDLIDGQLSYVTADAHGMHRLEHRLHLIGTALFVLTAMVCIGFLGFEAVFRMGLGGDLERVAHRVAIGVTVASGALPAIGAAIYGIRMQGDFAGIAERSETLAQHLGALKRVIAEDALSFDTLGRRARRAVDLLTADLARWRQTYLARPLSLPG